MDIINPGLALPFYTDIKSKLRHRPSAGEFNWAMPVDEGDRIYFQFPTNHDFFWDGTPSFYILDENEQFLTQVDTSFLAYSEDENGNAWISYVGNASAITSLACGVYSFQVFNRTTGQGYFSEDFRVMDLTGKKNAYRLKFNHSGEVDGVLYQLGIEQRVWLLDAILDTPEIVQPTETITDGNAVEVLTFQSVQRREVLKFPYLPDFWQGTLHRLRMLDSVTLRKMETGQDFELAGAGVDFSSEDQDIVFKKGVLSWIASTQVMGGCEENRTLVYTNYIRV